MGGLESNLFETSPEGRPTVFVLCSFQLFSWSGVLIQQAVGAKPSLSTWRSSPPYTRRAAAEGRFCFAKRSLLDVLEGKIFFPRDSSHYKTPCTSAKSFGARRPGPISLISLAPHAGSTMHLDKNAVTLLTFNPVICAFQPVLRPWEHRQSVRGVAMH